jgi:hypothetical protein
MFNYHFLRETGDEWVVWGHYRAYFGRYDDVTVSRKNDLPPHVIKDPCDPLNDYHCYKL